ncbi:MAG: DUF2585 family protein [bacterium]|nr:DUF2585 family protein [bacterium]
MPWYQRTSVKAFIIIFIGIIVAQIFLLYAMGRLPICDCGFIKFWEGDVMSSSNSQQISDWYTFSHIIHGFIFYALMYVVNRKFFSKRGGLPIGWWFMAAVLLEVGWEIIENSAWIINYYRSNTVSIGYMGDSILNSVFDVIWMSLGFFMARRLPVYATLALLIFFELMTGYFVRDGLALNILMFIYPAEAIKIWQTGV